MGVSAAEEKERDMKRCMAMAFIIFSFSKLWSIGGGVFFLAADDVRYREQERERERERAYIHFSQSTLSDVHWDTAFLFWLYIDECIEYCPVCIPKVSTNIAGTGHTI